MSHWCTCECEPSGFHRPAKDQKDRGGEAGFTSCANQLIQVSEGLHQAIGGTQHRDAHNGVAVRVLYCREVA